MTNPRRGLLANRQREKEEHLQSAFVEQPAPVKRKKDEGFKAARLSLETYDAIRDIYYKERLSSFAEAADIVMKFYLDHHNKNNK